MQLNKLAVRSMIRATPGNALLQVDLSQAETYVVAWLAQEDNMKDALLNADIHKRTASIIFEKPEAEIGKDSPERYIGKRVNHATSYGMSYLRFTQVVNADSDQSGVTITNDQSKSYQQKWFDYYTRIRAWQSEVQDSLNKNQRLLSTPYGRSRRFFNEWGTSLFKEAYAYIPQSTVADHAFGKQQRDFPREGGILAIYRRIIVRSNGNIRIVNTSHDSVMVEGPASNIKDIGLECRSWMQRPLLINGEECTIPADLEIGERWGEMEKMK